MSSLGTSTSNTTAARQTGESNTLISFALPCYNAAEYMDKCVQSILDGARNFLDRIEIILVDDGSTKDDTAAKADVWQAEHPTIIKAIHQENGGHGEAVNTGLAHATGKYFKVVDSDDWLDGEALNETLVRLKWLASSELDMFVTNYVYEKLDEQKRSFVRYKSVFPQGRIFGWEDIGTFKPQQNLLMHAVIYRTQLLRDIGLRLPAHTFYVDNIFVYVPLPAVKRIFYLDCDLYRYYIGREGQSVNETIMIGRIDQQLRVTRIMVDAFHLKEDVASRKLRRYMFHYLAMMMSICSIFLRLSGREDAEFQRMEILRYLKEKDPGSYTKIRGGLVSLGANLPGKGGRALSLAGYRLARKVFSFN